MATTTPSFTSSTMTAATTNPPTQIITPIPLPADDYDRPHSTFAALSSLRCTTASFEGALTALEPKTRQQHERIHKLQSRAAKCREYIQKLQVLADRKLKNGGGGGDVDDMVCTVFCSSSYEAALEGMVAEIESIKGDLLLKSNAPPHNLNNEDATKGEMKMGEVKMEGADQKLTTTTAAAATTTATKINKKSQQQQQQQQQQKQVSPHYKTTSVLEATRTAANSAVLHSLQLDAQTDDGEAIPSDAWLDHASVGVVGLGRALQVSERQRRVPHLLGDGTCMEEREYCAILDSLAMSSGSGIHGGGGGVDSLAGLAGVSGGATGASDDDNSVHSATSRMSALSVSSIPTSSSGRMTAAQRRRWHQQQQQLKNIKAGNAVGLTSPGASSVESLDTTASSTAEGFAGEGETPAPKRVTISSNPTIMKHPTSSSTAAVALTTQYTSIAGRSQSYTGSQPYLCEVLHDSYGIGSDPPQGLVGCSGFSPRGSREGGTEFYPPPGSMADLIVFNTTRDSYGLAKRRAAALMASAGAGPVGKGGENASISGKRGPSKATISSAVAVGGGGGGGGGATIPNSPKLMKKRSSGSGLEATSASLAKLAFAPDASAVNAEASSPALDLPDSLPVESA